MGHIEVRGLCIGKGKPKICVPLTGKNWTELKMQGEEIKKYPVDLVEWRMDYCPEGENKKELLKNLRDLFPNIPLLCTFRTKREGGERKLTMEEYVQLNKEIAETGLADLLDVELYTGDEEVKELIQWCHEYGVRVVLSNHDFDKTPSEEEIVKRLRRMRELGADIVKIAVMPQSAKDVLVLLSATEKLQAEGIDCPVITMSMGKMGAVSRIAGETFCSAVTFGVVTEASAPGQMPVRVLSEVLDILH